MDDHNHTTEQRNLDRCVERLVLTEDVGSGEHGGDRQICLRICDGQQETAAESGGHHSSVGHRKRRRGCNPE